MMKVRKGLTDLRLTTPVMKDMITMTNLTVGCSWEMNLVSRLWSSNLTKILPFTIPKLFLPMPLTLPRMTSTPHSIPLVPLPPRVSEDIVTVEEGEGKGNDNANRTP